MPRRRVAEKREVLPDPIYNSVVVTKFINGVMWEGKKAVAEKIFYGAMKKVADKTGEEPLKVFKKALENVAPVEVTRDRKNTLAIRWIVGFARGRGEKTMQDRLVGELIDAMNNRGGSVKKKEDVHRMADANKAFAHYRF